MTPKKNALEESSFIIREIESNLDKALQKRREEVERELEAKIRREREEHEQRLRKLEEDFAREKETIKDYQTTIADFEATREKLQIEIKDHLEKSIGYQKDIERLAALTLEELKIVAETTSRLSEVRGQAEEKVDELRTRLRDKYGIVAEEALPKEEGEVVVNLEQELSKLKRIKELLESDAAAAAEAGEAEAGPAPEPAFAPAPAFTPEPTFTPEPRETPAFEPEPTQPPEPPSWSEPSFTPEPRETPAFEPETGPEAFLHLPEEAEAERLAAPEPVVAEEESHPSFKMPEINQFIEEFVRREHEKTPEPAFTEPETFTAKPNGRNAVFDELNFQAVFETLEKYRKSEPTDYNGEISYFQNRERSILDGESLIRAIGHMLEEARKLYDKLEQTASPKDQFFIKQELINFQEILRKIILRAVKLCERESSNLPRFTEDVLNLAVLKEILEKLNLDNWSNVDDFRSFEAMSGRLKDGFYRRITPPAHYLRSIVQELEG